MKQLLYNSFIVCLITGAVAYGRDTLVADTGLVKEGVVKKSKPVERDTSQSVTTSLSDTADAKKEITKQDTQSDFDNPFVSSDDNASIGDSGQTAGSDSLVNPFVSEETPVSEPAAIDEGEERGVDILVDLGLGISLPRFFIKPAYIATTGRPRFLINPGVMLPFGKKFFAWIALRYLQLSVDLGESYATVSNMYPVTRVKIDTQELMSFLSLPVKVGMRFETAIVTPFVYLNVEPAYLTGSNQFVKQEIHTTFSDGSEYFLPGEQNTEDITTTDYRERHQIFIGGGLGFEISYGYGFVYIDAGCQYAVFETDNSTEQAHSKPWRNSCRVIYFPVSLGIRFYL